MKNYRKSYSFAFALLCVLSCDNTLFSMKRERENNEISEALEETKRSRTASDEELGDLDRQFLKAIISNNLISVQSILSYSRNNPPLLKQILTAQYGENEFGRWFGRTGLIIAAGKGTITIVQEILNSCCDDPLLFAQIITAHDPYKYTAFLLAVLNGHNNIVKEILNRCKNNSVLLRQVVTAANQRNHLTALHFAAQKGNITIAQEILNQCHHNPQLLEQILTAQDINGETALHHAAQQGNISIVQEIIKRCRAFQPIHNQLVKTLF